MKRLIMVMLFLGLFVGSAYAADVVITITIPDQHVSRVQAAVEGELFCTDGINAKECLTRHIINDIKALVKSHERKATQEGFEVIYEDIEVD